MQRNITAYDYADYPISFVGATACLYSEVLTKVADDFGAKIKKIIKGSMPGLIEFHTDK